MKSLRVTLCSALLTSIGLFGCGEEIGMDMDTESLDGLTDRSSLISDTPFETPPIDPEPETPIDWEQDQLFQMCYFSAPGGCSLSRLPYFDGQGPASDLNTGSDRDITAADGWVLVYQRFGTEQEMVTTPFFVLYNTYRGLLRLFFFNTMFSETYSYAMVGLKQPFPGQTGPLFNFGDPGYFSDGFDESKEIVALIEMAPAQWSYADFEVTGYTPELPMDSTLEFEVWGFIESDVSLDGTLTLDQVFRGGGGGGGNATLAAVQNVEKRVKEGYKWHKNVKGAIDSLQGKVSENPGTWWADLIGPVVEGAKLGPIAGAAAGVAGFFKSFLFPGKANARQTLNFEGELELAGTIETQTDNYILKFRTPGAPLSEPDDHLAPFYDKPLGIYNISRPVFSTVRETVCENGNSGPPDDFATPIVVDPQCYFAFGTRLQSDSMIVEINPHIGASAYTTVGLFGNDYQSLSDGEEVEYSELEPFRSQVFQETRPTTMFEGREWDVAIQIEITPPVGSRYESPIVLMNTHDAVYEYTFYN
ncbi:MAG: hypothetical protein AAF605_03985 [Myxococcota bacterium]